MWNVKCTKGQRSCVMRACPYLCLVMYSPLPLGLGLQNKYSLNTTTSDMFLHCLLSSERIPLNSESNNFTTTTSSKTVVVFFLFVGWFLSFLFLFVELADTLTECWSQADLSTSNITKAYCRLIILLSAFRANVILCFPTPFLQQPWRITLQHFPLGMASARTERTRWASQRQTSCFR